eukprot:COSAG04_NODE_3124_length_3143_cov_1.603154_3_plen_389_part_01
MEGGAEGAWVDQYDDLDAAARLAPTTTRPMTKVAAVHAAVPSASVDAVVDILDQAGGDLERALAEEEQPFAAAGLASPKEEAHARLVTRHAADSVHLRDENSLQSTTPRSPPPGWDAEDGEAQPEGGAGARDPESSVRQVRQQREALEADLADAPATARGAPGFADVASAVMFAQKAKGSHRELITKRKRGDSIVMIEQEGLFSDEDLSPTARSMDGELSPERDVDAAYEAIERHARENEAARARVAELQKRLVRAEAALRGEPDLHDVELTEAHRGDLFLKLEEDQDSGDTILAQVSEGSAPVKGIDDVPIGSVLVGVGDVDVRGRAHAAVLEEVETARRPLVLRFEGLEDPEEEFEDDLDTVVVAKLTINGAPGGGEPTALFAAVGS